ncbi:CAP domain-containing protein [Paenibacillus macerans]|uniref:CAP domain-containing protein n=1 Tax=Paenibacillus macerans TaxID=44252 RepID=UPI00203F484F|nr:CAP domain-containing protein [Paenibacillus macerans]MCM3702513.1 CAP domain-containing protein [Paenibacillus macerans]
MKSNRMKRLVSGGLTALVAAALIVPATASAASDSTTYRTYTTYKTYTVNVGNSADYPRTTYYTIPWYLFYNSQPVTSNPNSGSTAGKPQTGTTQGNTQSGNTQSGTGQKGTAGNSGSSAQQGAGTTTDKSQFATQVIKLVNQERAKQGLKPLTGDSALNNMALAKAKDMSQNNYFSHTSPTYGSPFDMMTKFGIKYSYAGENIAMGQKTPQEVVNAWMNSEGHRANILNANYNLIGVGYYNGYWAQEFVGR